MIKNGSTPKQKAKKATTPATTSKTHPVLAQSGMRDNEGFAKLRGYNIEYFIQKLSVTLGRTVPLTREKLEKKQLEKKEAGEDEKTQLLKFLLQEQEVDIPLGPYKNISRKHARISYNFALKCFELFVLSKNGAKVDGKYYDQNSPAIRLHNGSEVQLGDAFFIFQLPSTGSDSYLQKSTSQRIIQQQNQLAQQKKATANAKVIKTAKVATLDKPNVSYATMIAQALASSPNRTLSLQQIYQWISDTYPYYTQAEVGWKSSVRHNLSHSKFFHKVPQEETEANQRGIYMLNPEYEEDLLQGLTGRKLKNRVKEKEGEAAVAAVTTGQAAIGSTAAAASPQQATTGAALSTKKSKITVRKAIKRNNEQMDSASGQATETAAKRQKVSTPITQTMQPGMAFNMLPFAINPSSLAAQTLSESMPTFQFQPSQLHTQFQFLSQQQQQQQPQKSQQAMQPSQQQPQVQQASQQQQQQSQQASQPQQQQ